MITLRLIAKDRHPQKIRINKNLSIDEATKIINEKLFDQELDGVIQLQYKGHNLKDPHPFVDLPEFARVIVYQDLSYSYRNHNQGLLNDELLDRLGEIFNDEDEDEYGEDEDDSEGDDGSEDEEDNQDAEGISFFHFQEENQTGTRPSPEIEEETAEIVWNSNASEEMITQHLDSIQYEALQDESHDFYNLPQESDDISRRIRSNPSNLILMQVHHLTHPSYPNVEESELFNRMCTMLDIDLPQAYESEEIAQLQEMTKDERKVVDQLCRRGFDIHLAIRAAVDSNFDIQLAIRALSPVGDID